MIWYFCLFLSFSSFCVCQQPTSEQVFDSIYKNATWGKNSSGEGFSGGGSLVLHAKEYMTFLQNFLKTHTIKTVVDVGCGDWEFSRHMDWSGIRYLGIDVVPSVIEKNKKLFSSPTISFLHLDCTQTPLPRGDLLICKDVLQHLPNKDILLLLNQCRKFRFALITNDIDPTVQNKNSDTHRGGYHILDLTKPPFNMKAKKVLTYQAGGTTKQVTLIEFTAASSS